MRGRAIPIDAVNCAMPRSCDPCSTVSERISSVVAWVRVRPGASSDGGRNIDSWWAHSSDVSAGDPNPG